MTDTAWQHRHHYRAADAGRQSINLHAAPWGQQPYLSAATAVLSAAPAPAASGRGGVTVEKKSHGGRITLLAFRKPPSLLRHRFGRLVSALLLAGGNDLILSSGDVLVRKTPASTLLTLSFFRPTRRWQRPSRRRRSPWLPSMCNTRTSPMRAACTVLKPENGSGKAGTLDEVRQRRCAHRRRLHHHEQPRRRRRQRVQGHHRGRPTTPRSWASDPSPTPRSSRPVMPAALRPSRSAT